MLFRSLCLAVFLSNSILVGSPSLFAQNPVKTDEERKVLFNKHQADFDYLLGDWEFSGVRKRPGAGPDQKLHGYLSAARFPQGPTILSTDRFLNDDGTTFFTSSTLSAYNAALDQWELVSTDDGGFGIGLQDHGIAHRDGDEVHIEMRFGSMSGRPTIWRIRHYDIQPNRYSLLADRSIDLGKTWVTNYEQVEVRRLGPRRTLYSLIPANKMR